MSEIQVLVDEMAEIQPVVDGIKEIQDHVRTLSNKVDSFSEQKKPLMKTVDYEGISYDISGKRAKQIRKHKQNAFERLSVPYLKGEFVPGRTFEEMCFIVRSILEINYEFDQEELFNLFNSCNFERTLKKASKKIRIRTSKIKRFKKAIKNMFTNNFNEEVAYTSAKLVTQQEIIGSGIGITMDSVIDIIRKADIATIIAQTIKFGSPIIINCIFRLS